MNLDELLELYLLSLRNNYVGKRFTQILQDLIIAAYEQEFGDDNNLEEFEKVERNSLKQ